MESVKEKLENLEANIAKENLIKLKHQNSLLKLKLEKFKNEYFSKKDLENALSQQKKDFLNLFYFLKKEIELQNLEFKFSKKEIDRMIKEI